MNPDQREPTFEESFKQVMRTLPPIIRNYLSQGRYTNVARNLMSKYGLRVDQGGILEREIMLLLMGIENPEEFAQALVEEAKISEQIVMGIAQDVNDQIFVPLREQMRKESSATPEQVRPAQQPVQQQTQPVRVPPSQSINRISYAPTPAPAQQPSQAQMPTQSVPSAPPIQQRPVNQQAPRATSGPSLRDVLTTVTGSARPLDSKKLLEDHEEPHIEFHKPPAQAFVPMPQAPRVPPPLVPTPTQRNFPPPQNLPGTLPPRNESPLPPIPRPYASDPYRELID